MNDMTPSPRPRSKRLRTTGIVVGAVLAAAAAGTAVRLAVGTDSSGDRAGCGGILADKLTKQALGGTYRSDLSCPELGGAVVKATVGGGGVHTLLQASAMKNVLLAVDNDIEKRGTPYVDPGLRAPLAEALAQYTDVNVVLSDPTDSVYLDKSLPHSAPWKKKDGYHLSVAPESLVRVLRAVSDDPEAYATVRGAQTRWEAERLAGLSAGAEPVQLSVGARALGKLDGVAADVRRGLSKGEAEAWNATMSERLAAGASPVPDAKADLASHLERGWRQGLAAVPVAERASAVEQQCARMLNLWAEGVHTARSRSDAAVNQCLGNAAGNRTRAEQMLR
ncbi:hypothetical protein ACIRP2_38640 [Streptomyces sp. NPDC101194]|uniref:hypothetical protein n=1 Tax=Streptomyces sp. NPDC101194 TaxID=3366127 RepID=UPI0037F28E0C